MVETDYVSDGVDVEQDALIDGEPFCTISLDLSQLNNQQMVMLAQELGFNRLNEDGKQVVGDIMTGSSDEVWADVTASLHLDAGRAITMLQEVGIIDLAQQQPEAAPEEAAQETEAAEEEGQTEAPTEVPPLDDE